MIKIINPGIRPPKTYDIYKKICVRCKCEFEFDWGDIQNCADSATTYEPNIACPNCGMRMPVKPRDKVREEIVRE